MERQMMELDGNQSADVVRDSDIVVRKNASATVVIRPAGKTSIRLEAGEGSVVRCYMVCGGPASVALDFHVAEGAKVFNSCLWLAGGSAKVRNVLEGRGAEAYDIHAFIGRGESGLSLDSVLCHAAHGTRGEILVKGVVDDSASADLGGMIRIEKAGAGAESFLAEHVLLLGPDARAAANPELEIMNNDVSSRHSASVSQIDARKIFYLMSRGLAMDEAEGLIVEGFLESAIARVGEESWRSLMMERARGAISRRKPAPAGPPRAHRAPQISS